MKVLIIPSWLSLNGLVGSFFREQAEVLNDNFEIKFLYGTEIKYNLAGTLKLLFHVKSIFDRQIFKKKNDYFFFQYPHFNFLSEKFNLKIKKKFYKEQVLKISKSTGWVPELIHAQSTFDGGIISYYLSIVFTIPFIITEHNLFLLGNKDSERKREAKKSLENASKVLVVSNDKARQILIHNINIEPVIVGNLINEELFFYKTPQLHDEFVITTVGHFSYLKDYPTFFKTISLIKKSTNRSIKINCIGFNCWDATDHYEAINNLAIKFNVTELNLIPNVPREKMNNYYWGSDIFVLTSIAEGMPVSALEALACGRPVFATRCGGIEEVVNFSNGAIVPVRNAEMLAERIVNHISGFQQFDYAKISNEALKLYGTKSFSSHLSDIYNSFRKEFILK